MNVVHIFLDADRDSPLKGFPPDKVIQVDSGIAFSRLERGMVGGRSSVAIVISLPDGRKVFAQCSMRNFEMVADAFAGAEARQRKAQQEN